MLNLLQGATLVAATMTIGLMAGVFGLYAHAIMPGLGKTDDRTFVGALIFTGLAAVLQVGEDGQSVLPWIAAAFALYLAAFVITIRVHVPLNDEIKAAGNPDHIADLATVRGRFDEARWARWNVVRAVASTVALGCLALALMG